MKRNLKSLILITVIVTSVFIGGCSLGRKEKVDTQNNMVNPKENIIEHVEDNNDLEEGQFDFQRYESIISEEETPYVLINEDGEKVYLDEMSPEVIALSMAVVKYGEAMHNIDYETATGLEEYDLLTPELQQAFTEEDASQMLLEFYEKYKIKKEFIGIESYNYMEFNKDEAIVDVDYAFMCTNVEGIEGYEVGVVYYVPTKLKYKLVDDRWLMDEVLEIGEPYYYEEE